jgi:hypothetical protein
MKNLKLMIALASLMALAPMVTASAETEGRKYDMGIESRQYYQHARIDQGDRSGALSWRESGRLERQEARDRDDGRFTTAERARIQHQRNEDSHRIYREKHNRDWR